MRILFDIGHPADVHFFKNIIHLLQLNNHSIKICVRERENITTQLLDLHNLDYELIGYNAKGIVKKAFILIKNDYMLYNISKEFNPDIFVSLGSPYSAQVSKLLGKKSITYYDTDTANLIIHLTMPFTDVMLTPFFFFKDLGPKQIRVKGYKELAYLHPRYFTPDPGILDILGISQDEKYVILRFSAFDASHDVGVTGFSDDQKRELVRSFEKQLRVFISSEIPLPPDLAEYQIKIPIHKMHDAIYFAEMLVGDSGTMTAEAGIIGTPAVVYHPMSIQINYLNELENKYGLVFNFTNATDAINMAKKLIEQTDLKKIWQQKVDRMLQDKIDISAFFVWFIENFPRSFDIMKEDPHFQKNFL
ncbi:MAG: DUF354 domain-containing protein [Methanoregula sp.]|uniref:DUF354 domain-containing protein n=1 Tax=Methanoregula sp. TaxID=2052170 RepID=UPI0025D6B98D|nr:DUF354 domain-containing protein [Methanoregula sp.]MCK9631753.1 DUF354 domain-containing protein [Methanoregula sp.]